MRDAGFELARYDGHVEPGIWMASTEVAGEQLLIPVDLIVPEAAATGGGRRSARLGAHGRHAARRAVGLEAALIDHVPMTLTALDSEDRRAITANVAGPAALLVAKAHKIHDRVQRGRPERIDDKDAADVLRLMQTTDPTIIGATLKDLAAHPVAGGRCVLLGDRAPGGTVRPSRATRCRDGRARAAPGPPQPAWKRSALPTRRRCCAPRADSTALVALSLRRCRRGRSSRR